MKTIGNQKSEIGKSPAFTLIELLVVISIIGVLAAFSIPALRAFKRAAVLGQTKGEMAKLETAIDSYKAAYGFYPASNSKYDPSNPATREQASFNPLYFELLGTTNNLNTGQYVTLDGSITISDAPATVRNAFGVDGFVNCMKPGAGEDAPKARSFLSDLKPRQFNSNGSNATVSGITLLTTAVGGPDQNYQPLGASDFNAWRYVCPGVNNPNSYDLWIQLSIYGKTNLICNWNKQVTFNSPLP